MVVLARRLIRGEIWWADLDPVIGSEQAGKRPVLIISSHQFQRIQSRLIMIVPLTSTIRGFTFHLEVSPAETGLPRQGAIMCDQVRTISTQRISGSVPIGKLSPESMTRVEDLIRVALGL